MARYVFKRILIMIPVILGVIFIIFTISELTPGDPAALALGNSFTQERYEQKVVEMGLDKPFLVRFVNYIIGIVTRWDWGTSYANGRSVSSLITGRIAVTLELGLISCIITTILGLVIGVLSAVKQYSALDYTTSTLAIIFSAMPNFWMAVLGILIFSTRLHWLPASGLGSFKNWIMPVICNSLGPVCLILRTTRSTMLDVINQDYIRTARAKGVSERQVILRHALKNAIIPTITVIGMQLSLVVGGSVVVETIFNINGLGLLMMNSISNRDYPTIQGIVLLLAVTVCVINLLVDLAYAAVDPRIKAQYVSSVGKKSRAKKKEAGA